MPSQELIAFDYFDRGNGGMGNNWFPSAFTIVNNHAQAPIGTHVTTFTGYTPPTGGSADERVSATVTARIKKPLLNNGTGMDIGLIHQAFPQHLWPSGAGAGAYPLYVEFRFHENAGAANGTWSARRAFPNNTFSQPWFTHNQVWTGDTYKTISARWQFISGSGISVEYKIDGTVVNTLPFSQLYNPSINGLPVYAGLRYSTPLTGTNTASTTAPLRVDWITITRDARSIGEQEPQPSPSYALSTITQIAEPGSQGSLTLQPDIHTSEDRSYVTNVQETEAGYYITHPKLSNNRRYHRLIWTNRDSADKDTLVTTFVNQTGVGPITWVIPGVTTVVMAYQNNSLSITQKAYNVFDCEASFVETL